MKSRTGQIYRLQLGAVGLESILGHIFSRFWMPGRGNLGRAKKLLSLLAEVERSLAFIVLFPQVHLHRGWSRPMVTGFR